jgi:hypothetical protein
VIVAADERESLLHDLMVETGASWNAMPLAWRAVTVAGVVVFVGLNLLVGHEAGGPLIASLRVLALIAMVGGSVESARVADEFYQRVYLHACAYAFIASTLILYGLFEFGVNLGVRSVSVVVATFLISFVAAFAVNRRG